MSEHVLTVLRTKRAEIAEQVSDTEKKLARLRGALANLDAAMNILTPDHPDYVKPRRSFKRSVYFARNELSRLVRDALRQASKPLSAGEIAASIIAAKSYPEASHFAITKMIVARLNAFVVQGSVVKSGNTRGAKWAIAAE